MASIVDLERSVLAALPTGTDNYVWGRVRPALDLYVAECRTLLAAMCGSSPSGGGGDDEIGHPSTTFTFLYALSSSLRRIEAQLPTSPGQNRDDPLAAHLLPLLINYWHLFLTRLSTAVHHEGKMVSAGVVRTWFTRLEELVVDTPGVGTGTRTEGGAKRALEGVRERMIREMGWTIGLRPVLSHDMGEDNEDEL